MSRRFIAGATCPECGVTDKIVLIISGSAKVRECVKCGFVEQLAKADNPVIEMRTITIQASGSHNADSTDK